MMPLNRFLIFLLLILASSSLVNSKWLGLPDQIKNLQVYSYHYAEDINVHWLCFESDVISYNVHFLDLQNGTTRNISVEPNRRPYYDYCDFKPCTVTYLPLPSHSLEDIEGLEQNKTYVITVSAVNPRGEGPPSPAVYYSVRRESISQLFASPSNARIASKSGNRLNITFGEHYFPPEFGYALHYGDPRNLSDWNSIYTKNESIILDTLQNDKLYNFYVEARFSNLPVARGYTMPILVDGDLTGLPEPVITIDPANRTYVHGDRMTIGCTLPQNTHMKGIEILLTVGKLSDRRRGLQQWALLETTADELIDTAECVVSYDRYRWERITRRASKTWKVQRVTKEDHWKQGNEEVVKDQLRMEH